MRDFPQDLVNQVLDELFALVGRDNSYQGCSKRSRHTLRPDCGISDYLVSKAWVGPTQKHHFSILRLDCPEVVEKWLANIPPDPTGVSRHVRKLVLDDFYPECLEVFEKHLRAFTQVERLAVDDCGGILNHPSITEWFSTMGSSLVELRINDSPVTAYTITSLLAALPLLQSLDLHDFQLDDAHEANPSTPTRIPFFEGANRFVLRCGHGHRYPAGSLHWIPSSARFGQLEVDMACSIDHIYLVNRWLASSSATLTNLTIREDPQGTSPPK